LIREEGAEGFANTIVRSRWGSCHNGEDRRAGKVRHEVLNTVKTVRLLALITLGFLGVTSLMGPIPLILDPSGGMLHLPPDMLAHSPFHNFLIPGIMLLTANGFLSLAVLWAGAVGGGVAGEGARNSYSGCRGS